MEEVGAGIQLFPNATRVLTALGLAEALAPAVVATQSVRLRVADSGGDIASIPLTGYDAPYWVVHRADLQAVLLAAVERTPGISVRLGTRVDGFVAGADGVAITTSGAAAGEQHGRALIGADGLWSRLREALGKRTPARFAGRTAWRAVVPASEVAPSFLVPEAQLWLGTNGHIVHYPIRAGAAVNVVAITTDDWQSTQWSDRGRSHRGAHALSAPAVGERGARAPRRAGPLAEMGALRPRPVDRLGPRTGDADRRRRPSDAAVPRARRRHGDRGCGGRGRRARALARRSGAGVPQLRARAHPAHRGRAARVAP